jgi:hypothetical protein
MASAGTVTVDFAAETAKFTAELKKVQQSLGRVEQSLQTFDKVARVAFRFFTAGALISFTKSAFAAADATADAAERAGIAVESFSRLQFAASQTDVEMQALTSGIQKFQVTLSKASTGSKEAATTLARFGVSAQSLGKLKIEDQIAAIANAFQGVTDPADRTRLAVELFGKSAGPQLVPLLAQGEEGIKKFFDQADRLGLTLSSSTAAAIDETDKAIKRLTATAKAAVADLIGIGALFLSPPDSQEGKLLVQIRSVEGFIRDIKAVMAGERGLQIFRDPEAEAQRLSALTTQLATLQEQLRGIRGETAASKLNNLLPLPFLDPLQSIDIAAIQALKINVDELGQAFDRLGQSIIEIQNARSSEALQLVNDAVLENQRQIEQLATAEFQAELDKRSAATQAAAEFRIRQEERAANAMVVAQRGAFNAAIGALQSFAGQSKKVAIALVLINKARAIAEAIQNTALGATLQLTTGDPYTAIARAAAVKAFGAIQIAAIVASGFGEIKAINASGGAPLGSPSNPINTQSQLNDQQFGASSSNVIQVVIANNVGFDQRVTDQLINAIREAADERDVIIFGPESRQAKELVVVNG